MPLFHADVGDAGHIPQEPAGVPARQLPEGGACAEHGPTAAGIAALAPWRGPPNDVLQQPRHHPLSHAQAEPRSILLPQGDRGEPHCRARVEEV